MCLRAPSARVYTMYPLWDGQSPSLLVPWQPLSCQVSRSKWKRCDLPALLQTNRHQPQAAVSHGTVRAELPAAGASVPVVMARSRAAESLEGSAEAQPTAGVLLSRHTVSQLSVGAGPACPLQAES